MRKNRITELRVERGWSQAELAQRVGTTGQQIGRLEAGVRRLTVDWMDRLAQAFDVPPVDLLTTGGHMLVPLVGYVGAGSEAHFYAEADMPGDFVARPPKGTDETVAVEIRGDSLGSMFNHWLVFYDAVRTPPRREPAAQALCGGAARWPCLDQAARARVSAGPVASCLAN